MVWGFTTLPGEYWISLPYFIQVQGLPDFVKVIYKQINFLMFDKEKYNIIGLNL